MKSPARDAGQSGEFAFSQDERLFGFINTLRATVRARVTAEKLRGMSLPEIVLQVREMVRLAEIEGGCLTPFPAYVFRAVLGQALAWSANEYRLLLPPPPEAFA